ncbi:MAG: 2Fe-2S iron-sulfur cluster binding domain-containing protein [Firmicutes bacterium]|nr:2Fe-2S iron-sulfur cluster binding domain-containing protein [Bacillota bacterium]
MSVRRHCKDIGRRQKGAKFVVTLTIDGQKVTVPANSTVLEAAEAAGIHIPTLCYLKDISQTGACRVCVVEIGGRLQAACVFPVHDGMVVETRTPLVRESRRVTVELLLSNHPQDCLTCLRNQNCELQQLTHELNIRDVRFKGARTHVPVDDSSPAIVRDPDKCILCRRCIGACSDIQGVDVLAARERGFETVVSPAWQAELAATACTNCGQCVLVCPVGALVEKDDTDKVWAALANPEVHVVVQTAPAVRVALGEEFGMKPGTVVTGKMTTALRRLGFDAVFDTDFTADLTIMEEANELLERLQQGTLPMITSCSPGWIKFIEHQYPELLSHLSTCKSPQQMFGALAKTYYPEKVGLDPAKIVTVSIMPCTAKKYEAHRPEMNSSGFKDVDIVLTVREFARMIKEAGIDFPNLPDGEYDAPMGISTGAGVIFGATGGVMEAALRTAYEVVTGKTLTKLDFLEVRGLDGIKEAEVALDGVTLKVAIANGLGNARQLMDMIKRGEAEYHFIEIMACPGGCIGGGGQPIPTNTAIRKERMAGIYAADQDMPLRKSHENPGIKILYEEFLGEPLGEKSHELLHTPYVPRSKFGDMAGSRSQHSVSEVDDAAVSRE